MVRGGGGEIPGKPGGCKEYGIDIGIGVVIVAVVHHPAWPLVNSAVLVSEGGEPIDMGGRKIGGYLQLS